MRILWFTWKDLRNPRAGGAERVNEELIKRLARRGDEVLIVTAGFRGGAREESVDGYRVLRLGSRWTVYGRAFFHYQWHLRGRFDLVIDEMNTLPFFAKFYAREKNILFVHQLCREIWFYEMCWPLSYAGYLLEPLYLRLLRDRQVLTISESTRQDLLGFGFGADRIRIIGEGIDLQPAEDLATLEKYPRPTLLSFGAVRAMKRTDHLVRAFELAKKRCPELRLIVAGDYDNPFGRKVFALARRSPYRADIFFTGRVSRTEKIELMRRSHVLLAASVKEGWGLVVTEANSQGTPAIAYDVDGLRDSVCHGRTGILCRKNTPAEMAASILLMLEENNRYERMRRSAWQESKKVTFENCFAKFERALDETALC